MDLNIEGVSCIFQMGPAVWEKDEESEAEGRSGRKNPSSLTWKRGGATSHGMMVASRG